MYTDLPALTGEVIVLFHCKMKQNDGKLMAFMQTLLWLVPANTAANPPHGRSFFSRAMCSVTMQKFLNSCKTSRMNKDPTPQSHSKPQQVRSISKHQGDIHSICQGVIMLWPDTPVTLEPAFAHKKACEDAEGWSCGQFGIFLRRTSLKNALSNTQPQAENVTAFQKDPQ